MLNEIEIDRQFTPEKLVTSKKLVELVSCKESGVVGYSVKQFNIEQQKSVCNIHAHNAEAMSGSQLTRCPLGKQCSTPQFITNYGAGTVDSMCFLRDGQVWMMPMSRGEAVQVTNLPLDVECYRVYQNKFEQIFMLVVMDVYADKTPAETKEIDAKPPTSSAMEFDSLMVRHWDRWQPYAKRHHIFLLALEVTADGLLTPMQRKKPAGDASSKQAVGGGGGDMLLDLMFGWESDCPGKAPGQGEEDFAVSPDGTLLAFACRTVTSKGGARCSAAPTSTVTTTSESEEGGGCNGGGKAAATSFSKAADMAWSTDTSVYLLNLPKHYEEMETTNFTPTMNCCCSGACGACAASACEDSSCNECTKGDKKEGVDDRPCCGCSAAAGSKFRYTVVASRTLSCACGCICRASQSTCNAGSVNSAPVFSPNGAYLVYTCRARAQFESDIAELKFYHVASGVTTAITSGIDLSFDGSVEWCSGGDDTPLTFYSFAQFHASMRIFRVTTTAVDSDATPSAAPLYVDLIEVLNGDRSCMTPKFIPARRDTDTDYLYYIESSVLSAPELKLARMKRSKVDPQLFSVFAKAVDGKCVTSSASGAGCTYKAGRVTGAGVQPLTENAAHCIISVYSCAPEFENNDIAMPDELVKHYFVGANSELIQAWYLPPVLGGKTYSGAAAAASVSDSGAVKDLSTPRSVPLAVIIHGGPQGAVLNQWHYRWNMAIFAALGYGVVAINFHGSTGFGQAFTDSITGDWGGKPYHDIMIGVRYILSAYPYLNSEQVAGLGASYGGYMINWINGHNTDGLFKCLVNHDGVFDQHSMYYTTEELYFSEFEFGLPWEQKQLYAHLSPSSYVSNWNTPTLVIHGGKDYRVPETEGIATFTALQRRGVPSKFIYFPDENHWVLKPLNSIKWHRAIFEWLKQWIASPGPSSA